MKKKQKFRYNIKYPAKNISDDTYRLKSAKYPQFEDALYIWHQQKRSLKIPISDDILIEQAKVFGQYLSIDENDFKYSHG